MDLWKAVSEVICADARANDRGVLSEKALASLVEAAFYGSLAREEGVPVRFDLLLIDPKPPRLVTRRASWRCTALTDRIPIRGTNLSKIASAADPWCAALAVWEEGGEWFIWGLVDQQVHYNRRRYLDATSVHENPKAYRISVEDNGYLTVYWDYSVLTRQVLNQLLIRPARVLTFGLVANRVDEIFRTLVEEWGSSDEWERLEWRDRESPGRSNFQRVLKRILLHIAKYRHGGALLLTPTSGHDPDLNPKFKLKYDRLWPALLAQTEASVEARMRGLYGGEAKFEDDAADAVIRYREVETDREEALEEVEGCVHFIASLSRVDGLVMLTDRLIVPAFGVEIVTKDDPPSLVATTDEWATSADSVRRNPLEYGMRHRSMMRYCYAHPEAVGFVVSQDGPVRAMMRVDESVVFWADIEIREQDVLEQTYSPSAK